MPDRTYIVQLSGPAEHIAEYQVRGALYNSLPYSVDILSVRKHDPESEHPLNKIPAIKRVRELLNPCSLKDAKFLADIAEERGSASWGGITVSYAAGQFFVADNR